MQHPDDSVPVRMFLKASSTFVESKAEVSMNDRLFFSVESEKKTGDIQISFLLYLVAGPSSQEMFQGLDYI